MISFNIRLEVRIAGGAGLDQLNGQAEKMIHAYYCFAAEATERLNVTSRSSRIPINEPEAKAACLP